MTAVTLRRGTDSGLAAAKGAVEGVGLDLDPATRRVAPHVVAIRAAVLLTAFAVLLVQPYRTPELMLWTGLAVVVALLVVEFLAVAPRPSRPPTPEAPTLEAPTPDGVGTNPRAPEARTLVPAARS